MIFSPKSFGFVIYILKYCKEKRELWKFKYFTMPKYNLQKSPLKQTNILQDIITLELISSFNTSQNIIFQKSSYENRPIVQGPKSLKIIYSIMNLNTISLPSQATPSKRPAAKREKKEQIKRGPKSEQEKQGITNTLALPIDKMLYIYLMCQTHM